MNWKHGSGQVRARGTAKVSEEFFFFTGMLSLPTVLMNDDMGMTMTKQLFQALLYGSP